MGSLLSGVSSKGMTTVCLLLSEEIRRLDWGECVFWSPPDWGHTTMTRRGKWRLREWSWPSTSWINILLNEHSGLTTSPHRELQQPWDLSASVWDKHDYRTSSHCNDNNDWIINPPGSSCPWKQNSVKVTKCMKRSGISEYRIERGPKWRLDQDPEQKLKYTVDSGSSGSEFEPSHAIYSNNHMWDE